jgi:hypothetical protein
LILKDTALAQGDFERTSGGFANQMRILKASLSDAATEIGLILLPYFKNFVTTLNQTVVPAIKAFTENLEEKGVGGAIEIATASMGEFGVSTVNVMEAAYLAILKITNEVAGTVRVMALGAGLAYGLKKDLVRAGVALAVSASMKELQKSTQEGLDNAGALFDGFRQRVYLAGLQLANFGKPPKDVSDSLDRMGQATRSASLANNTFTSGIKEIIPSAGGASKAIKTAEEKLKEYSRSLKDSTSAQKSFNDAQKGTASATKSKADADLAVAKAQARLKQVSEGFGVGSPEALAAQRELEKAQRGQERATFAVEEAIYSVADAEKNLAAVRKDPESSPMDIRRAELDLAEAKLSVKDAIDSQIDSTKELNDQQTLLNETTFGATIGSLIYDEALLAVNDAKERAFAAAESLADAIDREREAQEKLNETYKATIDLMAKYPKVLGGMPNPMAGMVGQPANTAGVGAFSTRSGDTYAININAAIAEQGLPAKVVEALQQYNRSVGKIPVTTK